MAKGTFAARTFAADTFATSTFSGEGTPPIARVVLIEGTSYSVYAAGQLEDVTRMVATSIASGDESVTYIFDKTDEG